MTVTCPECGGTAHRLGESDVMDDDGNAIASRYVCHGEMQLRELGDGDKSSADGYPKGEFYVDHRNSESGDVEYISQKEFGVLRRRYST